MTIHTNGAGNDSDNAFDLEVRSKLARVTYQFPDDIADGIRMITGIELWAEVVRHHGSTGPAIKAGASALKGELTQIVNRRNKIVHEGDLQPGVPRIPWAISRTDVDHVRDVIKKIVDGIEAVV